MIVIRKTSPLFIIYFTKTHVICTKLKNLLHAQCVDTSPKSQSTYCVSQSTYPSSQYPSPLSKKSSHIALFHNPKKILLFCHSDLSPCPEDSIHEKR